jgi:hypothetical protein
MSPAAVGYAADAKAGIVLRGIENHRVMAEAAVGGCFGRHRRDMGVSPLQGAQEQEICDFEKYSSSDAARTGGTPVSR